MSYEKCVLDGIHQRTSGQCHICHKKLARSNYARQGARGAWEVEHSNPRALGGQNHGNNLFAACIPCNRIKGKLTTRTARRRNGKTRAPLSPEKRIEKENENAVLGALAGGVAGLFFGFPGAIVGALVGGALGGSSNPNEIG